MQSFLKKISCFFCIPLCLIIFFLVMLSYLNNKTMDALKLPSEINTVFLGDSHVSQGINDKIVPRSINFSENSESYLFSYYKIQAILKNNSQIKEMYLGFSYHNLSSYLEDFVYGDYSTDISTKYFFILPYSEKIKLVAHSSDNFISYFRKIIDNGTKISFLGGYQNNFKNTSATKESMDKRIQFQYYKDGQLNNFYEQNIIYLDKIIELCQKSNINLTILDTPLHPYYRDQIPQKYINRYNKIIDHYRLKAVNFPALELSNTSFVPDGDHLSAEGASLISKFLANKL